MPEYSPLYSTGHDIEMMEASRWQLLLDRLTHSLKQKGELEQYTDAQSNAQRIQICHSNDTIVNEVEQWMKSLGNPPEAKKHKERALALKTKGNKAYSKKENETALALYSQGILLCPDTDVSLLFGNRSAVLFNLQRWRQCVTDIDVALEHGFPAEKQWKLHKRKGEALQKMGKIQDSILCFETCLKLLKNGGNMASEEEKVYTMIKELQALQSANGHHYRNSNTNEDKPDNFNEISPLNGFNKKVTCASEAISLVENSIEGRHFIAKQTIEPGAIVIAEEPYGSVLLPDWFLSHCQHCFTKVSCVIPCKQCSQVCYCSMECRQQSWKKYHSFECGKLNIMKEIGVAHLALRIILLTDPKLLSTYFDDNIAKTSYPVDGVRGSNSNSVYENNYNSLYHLVTHSGDLQKEDLFQYTVAATLLLQVLSKNGYFPADADDKVKFQVGGLLLRHIQQIVCNAHAITSIESTSKISENIVEQDQVRIATALYATSSLLNHSCKPNILNTFHKNKLIVKVVGRIEKGCLVSTCYGPHYRRMDFAERQNALKTQYLFTCRCEPCSKGLRAMEEFDCYICPACNEGFFGDVKSCPNCLNEVNVKVLMQKSAESDKIFSLGMNLMEKPGNENSPSKGDKTIQLALTKFLHCLKLQESVYAKFHSNLGKTYDVIAKCFAITQKYSDSLVYLKKSLCLVEAHYGKESAELTNEYLKLCDVYFALLQKLIDGRDYKGALKYQMEAQHAVDRCVSLLERNREPESPDHEDMKSKRESLLKLSAMTSQCVR